MPRRILPLVNGQIYHIFNRGIDRRPTFTDKNEYQRALQVLQFYRFQSPPIKLSRFLSLPHDDQLQIIRRMKEKNNLLVTFYAYSLMPNHFHLLIKQEIDNGISWFMSQFQNSYVRYFNTKHERVGQLFLLQFKAVRIESDEQLVHVSRYIHLNEYTAYVVKTIEDLYFSPRSSLAEYLEYKQNGFCNTQEVLSLVGGKDSYKKLINDQSDYQRELRKIKHLTFDK